MRQFFLKATPVRWWQGVLSWSCSSRRLIHQSEPALEELCCQGANTSPVRLLTSLLRASNGLFQEVCLPLKQQEEEKTNPIQMNDWVTVCGGEFSNNDRNFVWRIWLTRSLPTPRMWKAARWLTHSLKTKANFFPPPLWPSFHGDPGVSTGSCVSSSAMQYFGGKLSAAQLQVAGWVGSVRRSLQGALDLVWRTSDDKDDEDKDGGEEDQGGGGRFERAVSPLRSFARRSRRSFRRFSMRSRSTRAGKTGSVRARHSPADAKCSSEVHRGP